MPETPQEILKAKVDFMRWSGFPLCIAAVDGTHVLIQSYGGLDAEVYRNRKMVFSHNCQLIVSADVINNPSDLLKIYQQKNEINKRIYLLSGSNSRCSLSMAGFST